MMEICKSEMLAVGRLKYVHLQAAHLASKVQWMGARQLLTQRDIDSLSPFSQQFNIYASVQIVTYILHTFERSTFGPTL